MKTGLVFEAYLTDHPEFGSIGGGGRYDDLTSQFINKKLPGVGASIGLTRLMDLIFAHNLLPAGRASATARRQQMTRLPDQGDVLRIAAFLDQGSGVFLGPYLS